MTGLVSDQTGASVAGAKLELGRGLLDVRTLEESVLVTAEQVRADVEAQRSLARDTGPRAP